MDITPSEQEIAMILRAKATLGVTDSQDPQLDEWLTQDVRAALEWVNALIGPDWQEQDEPYTRTYNAPPSSLRNIDALLADPVPAVHIYGSGTALVAGTNYRLLPANERSYTQIVRLLTGVPARWTSGHEEESEIGAIAVLGTWAQGSDASAMWEAKTIELYRARGFLYAGGGGNAQLGTASAASDNSLLQTAWRPTARQVELFGTE